MLVAAFSKLVPRALQKKVAATFHSSENDDVRINDEMKMCRVVLLDETEIQLDIRVSSGPTDLQSLPSHYIFLIACSACCSFEAKINTSHWFAFDVYAHVHVFYQRGSVYK